MSHKQTRSRRAPGVPKRASYANIAALAPPAANQLAQANPPAPEGIPPPVPGGIPPQGHANNPPTPASEDSLSLAASSPPPSPNPSTAAAMEIDAEGFTEVKHGKRRRSIASIADTTENRLAVKTSE